MSGRFSAVVILFTVRSASRYCYLYLSFSLSDLVSMTFFFRALLLVMACQISAVIHSFLFWSASQACLTDLYIGHSDLFPHGVDSVRAGRCTFFSIFQCFKQFLFFSWRVKVLFVLGCLSFFRSNCWFLALPGPFLFCFKSRAAVTRWWSLLTSASLLTLQRLSPCNDFLFVMSCPLWSLQSKK